ncbi:hypothetical protein PUN28_018387 [Cardiocondyla obscurior]|uniref:Secreted protein n=1 Tax=Cardiocondyla obscurior TaxID=286306 RepID=A0AAW2EL33_9HYME
MCRVFFALIMAAESLPSYFFKQNKSQQRSSRLENSCGRLILQLSIFVSEKSEPRICSDNLAILFLLYVIKIICSAEAVAREHWPFTRVLQVLLPLGRLSLASVRSERAAYDNVCARESRAVYLTPHRSTSAVSHRHSESRETLRVGFLRSRAPSS